MFHLLLCGIPISSKVFKSFTEHSAKIQETTSAGHQTDRTVKDISTQTDDKHVSTNGQSVSKRMGGEAHKMEPITSMQES